ncbi:MAG TPA: cytochrome b/b6 domain-containing protein, partial [Thermoleophilia bacterium]|nr:cytochrome b/b6 domain-containing protein [Thermoleophilia bacterium]
MSRTIDVRQERIKRHGFSGRFVHWTVALSTVVLVISGLGQLPLFKRYFVDTLPGLGWTSDFGVTLQLHYFAAAALTLAVVYHVIFHSLRREFDIVPRRGDLKESYQIIKAMFGRGEEPDSDKYLAEQRVAYAFIGGAILLVIATGYLKAVKNLPGVELPYWLLWTTTTLHNLAMFLIILGIGGHLAAFLIKENRALLPGMFTGRVSLAYARERHCLWCEGLGLSGRSGSASDADAGGLEGGAAGGAAMASLEP